MRRTSGGAVVPLPSAPPPADSGAPAEVRIRKPADKTDTQGE
jgi:hypothetical protein